ncbi:MULTISPECIES: MBL fold metallo-hydrolase [Phycicoccus]|jgi:glyoxylase-like metal-dependent hydrolase (beta-lactamase superfamily II)|uniref:MBL fold metallo-hydrolase n=1 Tax=Phycicoccus TaxID=367298 RepID=UPI002D0E9A4B|nr:MULTISPECIES: MBL fold metallo-hydrolase [Phycicoccus]HPF75716.1 MBL fold metallo-hydrolase [Phycicoccus elongatus]HPQ73704.1 MBL fold metallo-hydrolase [Phycicoccus elongatus]HRC18935.1 MBL fold metallo-hydrolase [Phycicoccus elongatus]HRV57631.1 MBL fold metallo-hydrolase [Phycicoccus sp.]
MTYTGDVTPGGPSDVRELPDLTIRKMSVSPMHNNVYLLTCRATGDQLLIDAADDPQRCLALVAEGTGSLHHLVTTHRHWDHTRALTDVAEATGAVTYAGDLDAEGLPVAPTVRLVDGDRISLGDLSLDVAIVSGHTAASVVLAYRDPTGHAHVFTGDTLFPGGVGATRNDPSQSFDDLYRDVTAKIFDRYDDDTWIYPGHGGDTTLGAERPHLAEWAERGW